MQKAWATESVSELLAGSVLGSGPRPGQAVQCLSLLQGASHRRVVGPDPAGGMRKCVCLPLWAGVEEEAVSLLLSSFLGSLLS